MRKLDPDALAEWEGEYEEEGRPGVQHSVTSRMITEYVTGTGALPPESAQPFGQYLYEVWHDYVDGETTTQGRLIQDALAYWRGHV